MPTMLYASRACPYRVGGGANVLKDEGTVVEEHWGRRDGSTGRTNQPVARCAKRRYGPITRARRVLPAVHSTDTTTILLLLSQADMCLECPEPRSWAPTIVEVGVEGRAEGDGLVEGQGGGLGAEEGQGRVAERDRSGRVRKQESATDCALVRSLGCLGQSRSRVHAYCHCNLGARQRRCMQSLRSVTCTCTSHRSKAAHSRRRQRLRRRGPGPAWAGRRRRRPAPCAGTSRGQSHPGIRQVRHGQGAWGVGRVGEQGAGTGAGFDNCRCGWAWIGARC